LKGTYPIYIKQQIKKETLDKSPSLQSPNLHMAFNSRIQLMNEAVLDCRVGGLLNLLNKQDYKKAAQVMNETIRIFDTAVENSFSKEFIMYVVNNLYHCLIELSFRKYDVVIGRLSNIQTANNIQFMV